jgi:hypothetical protein
MLLNSIPEDAEVRKHAHFTDLIRRLLAAEERDSEPSVPGKRG